MPVTYIIDKVKRRLYAAATGELLGTELLGLQPHLAADPDFEPSFSQLFDLTGVRTAEIDALHIRSMAETTVFDRGARRALVVGKPVLFGLARMFQILAEGRGGEIEIFTDRAEAEAWLDRGFDGPAPGPGDVTSEGNGHPA